MQSSIDYPRMKKASEWRYLFLSMRTYAFLTAALLFLGSLKSLCKKLKIASCSLESILWFLNSVMSRVFLPMSKYQKRQSNGSLFLRYY